MTSHQLAREALPQKLKRRFKRMLGPWGVFFEGFMKNPVMVGSIIPSSDRTIAKTLGPVNWDECRLFVEYGPGVGTFCRPVLDRLRRDGALIMVDDERMKLRDGEKPETLKVRFRTLGCYPLTGAVESNAESLTAIIQEMLLTTTSERQGRAIDHDQSASMEKKKREGYF